jgi:NADH:ubiquinone oxidoreductase subunit 3 (subunit A)
MFPVNLLLIIICIVPFILLLLLAIQAARFSRKKEEVFSTSIGQRKTDYRYLLKIFSIIMIIFLIFGIGGYLSLPYAIYYGLMGVPIESAIDFDGIFFTIPEKDKAEIYIYIITGLSGVGKTDARFNNYYIVCREKLSIKTMKDIQDYFSKYSINIKWISDRKEAPTEDCCVEKLIKDCCTGEIKDGILIDLGGIVFPSENKAYISIYTYLNGTSALGYIRYLEKIEGKWRFAGEPITIFIS